MGQTGFCEILQFPALFCDFFFFVRVSAKICASQMLQMPAKANRAATFCENLLSLSVSTGVTSAAIDSLNQPVLETPLACYRTGFGPPARIWNHRKIFDPPKIAEKKQLNAPETPFSSHFFQFLSIFPIFWRRLLPMFFQFFWPVSGRRPNLYKRVSKICAAFTQPS